MTCIRNLESCIVLVRLSSTISGDVSASVAQATAQADAQQQVTQPRAVNVANLQTNLEVNTVQAQGSASVSIGMQWIR